MKYKVVRYQNLYKRSVIGEIEDYELYEIKQKWNKESFEAGYQKGLYDGFVNGRDAAFKRMPELLNNAFQPQLIVVTQETFDRMKLVKDNPAAKPSGDKGE